MFRVDGGDWPGAVHKQFGDKSVSRNVASVELLGVVIEPVSSCSRCGFSAKWGEER